MQQRLELIEKRTEKLEVRSKMNSQNLSKPPLSNNPFNKQKKKSQKSKRNRGAQKDHKDHQQQMLNPIKKFLRIDIDGFIKSRLTVFIKKTDTVSKYLYLITVLGKKT